MIVRDEAHIIHESVAPHIDSWVIVDTVSTDGMRELIRRLMAKRGIPGELFERPWPDFGSNRTEAIQLAQGRGDGPQRRTVARVVRRPSPKPFVAIGLATVIRSVIPTAVSIVTAFAA